MNHPYDEKYYNKYGHDGTPYKDQDGVIETLVTLSDELCKHFMFYTHIDIGCAFGYMVHQMQYNGVRSSGCDISEYAIENGITNNLFQWDISKKPLFQVYDLVTCVEVIEHIDPAWEENAIYNICSAARRWLYFSSEYNLLEPTHVNCKYRHEWIGLIEAEGFRPVKFSYPYIPWGVMFERVK